MKLKGKNSKKIPVSKKEKMEKTLKRMEDARKKDTNNLRVQINVKKKYLVEQKEKAIKAIDMYKEKIIELEEMGLKIEGALVTLRELVPDDTDV